MNIVTKKKQTSLRRRIKYYIYLAVVPHKKNHHRPHLIRRYGLIGVVVFVLSLQLGHNALTTGTVLGDQSRITIEGLLDQTNAARASDGDGPLSLDEKLTKAAFLKAQDMFAKQYWAHNAPDGTEPWKWFGDVGYNYAEAGENLAKGFATNDATVAAWLHSPEHRENMLKQTYTQVGFATVSGGLNGKLTNLVVALYGKPAETGAVAAATTSFSEASSGSMGPIARIGSALQNLGPAALGSLIVVSFTAFVALLAHTYRKRLPKPLRQSWYRHHGAYKAVGMASLAFVIVTLYNGGQI